MRKTIVWAAFWAVIACGPAVMALADEAAPAGNGDQPAMEQGPGGGGMMGGDHMGKMKEKLGLTDDQAAKLKDVFKSQMEANKPLRDQMKIDMDKLQQKVDSKASDGDIKKLLDKLDSEQKQMQASREKMKDQLRSILTPTQQAKMVLGMRKMGMSMMEKWKGHPAEKSSGSDEVPGSNDGGSQN